MRDYDLLTGLLAYQLRLVSAGTLAAYAQALGATPELHLLDFLSEKQAITGPDAALLVKIVDNLVHAHAGDSTAALATFGGSDAAREAFAQSIRETQSGWEPTAHETLIADRLPHGLPRQIAPETVGRYTRGSEYARGGIGRILLVHDEQIGRDVILKELLPHHAVSPTDSTLSRLPTPESPKSPMRQSAAMMARFLQEAKITGQLEHPSIVPVYELGLRTDGQLYYTMKLVRGETLSVSIAACKSLDDRLALLRSFLDVCQAMAYAHSKGVIHRDLKPSNIMVGEFGECVVLDWGLAKLKKDIDAHAEAMERTASQLQIEPEKLGTAQTRAKDVLGTPLYMAPEQARGEVDSVSYPADVFSLGVILYEILTGEVPHRWTNTMDTIRRVGTLPVPPVRNAAPKTPPELAAICDKALQFDDANRYPTARELADDIGRFLQGAVVDAYAYRATDMLRRLYLRHKALIHTVSLATAIVLVVGVLSYINIYRARADERAARIVADEQRDIAEAQQREAEAQRDEATAQRIRAEAAEDQTAREKYISDIRLADVYVRDFELKKATDVLLGTRPEKRGIEWNLLMGACAQQLGTLRGHTRDVFAHISPDGARIMTLSGDSTARLWEAKSDTTLHQWDFAGARIADGVFDRSGARVAIWMDGGQIHIYDTASGTRLQEWSAHTRRLHHADFSPADAVLATTGGDRFIRLWNPENGQLLREIPTPDVEIESLRYSQDGLSLLGTSRDGTLQSFDAESGKPIAQTPPETTLLRAVGDALLVSMNDELALLSARSCAVQKRFSVGEPVSSADYHPPTNTVLYLSRSGQVKLWDISAEKLLYTFRNSGTAVRCMFSHDGSLALVVNPNGQLRSFDTETGVLVREFGGHSRILTTTEFAPDDSFILTGAVDGTATKWSPREDLHRAPLGSLPSDYIPIHLSDDAARMLATSKDGYFTLLDLAQNRPVYQGRASVTTYASNTAISPDGTMLCGALDEFLPLLIDVESGAVKARLYGHQGYITDIRFSADSSRILTSSWDGTARIWDTESGANTLTLEGHSDTVYACAFSPDARYVATASRDNTAIIWDVATGDALATLAHDAPVYQCAFSPDGAQLATTGRNGLVLLWDVASRSEKFRLLERESTSIALSFTKDSERLITSPTPNDLTIWDAEFGLPLAALGGHTMSEATWRTYIPAADALFSVTETGTIMQSLPFPNGPTGPVASQGELESALKSYRAQRAAWPTLPSRPDPLRLTHHYLPSPTVTALFNYLRERHQPSSANSGAVLTLDGTTPQFHPLDLRPGDSITAIAGQTPAAIFSTANTSVLDALSGETRDFEIDLLRADRALRVAIHREDIKHTDRTITLTHDQARALLEAAREKLQTGASTLLQVNEMKSTTTGTSPEGALWIPAPREREGNEVLQAAGLQALDRIISIAGKPVPNLEELAAMIETALLKMDQTPSIHLSVELERGTFEVSRLIFTN